ncbi:YaaA family protein [Fusibacter sp. JL298sf-3]
MKIVLSPSKTQAVEKGAQRKVIVPLSKAYGQLHAAILALDKAALGKALKIKGDMLERVYDLYHNSLPAVPALSLYTGPAFKSEAWPSGHPEGPEVWVFSALYGIVKADSFIKPYRLDMTAKVPGFSLYAYWKKPIETVLTPGMQVLDLASQEFSRLIPEHCEVLKVTFLTEAKDGRRKAVGYHNKVARGTFARWVLEKGCSSFEQLTDFSALGYKLDAAASETNQYVFVRPAD